MSLASVWPHSFLFLRKALFSECLQEKSYIVLCYVSVQRSNHRSSSLRC